MDDLERFVTAQAAVIDDVRRELADGAKSTHWMWFVFPQARGLGRSDMAVRYGIASEDEARRYRAHELLGPRLVETTSLVLRHRGRTLVSIFGGVDAQKFVSSMTLFETVARPDDPFGAALEAFANGGRDAVTLGMLGRDA